MNWPALRKYDREDKNIKNTADAAKNIEKYIKNTESSTDTDSILTSINQQPVNEQDSY